MRGSVSPKLERCVKAEMIYVFWSIGSAESVRCIKIRFNDESPQVLDVARAVMEVLL